MNTNLAAVSAAEPSCASCSSMSMSTDMPGDGLLEGRETCAGRLCEPSAPVWRTRQSGKLHARLAPYLAFVAAVFGCLVAAATVASQDVPLMLGGL